MDTGVALWGSPEIDEVPGREEIVDEAPLMEDLPGWFEPGGSSELGRGGPLRRSRPVRGRRFVPGVLGVPERGAPVFGGGSELYPGGAFRTVMRSPDGQDFANTGCILEVVPDRRLAWTGALRPGYRPYSMQELQNFPFTFSAVITMEQEGQGTRYRALAIHPDVEAREKHDQMGFHTGWSVALDQLVAVMKQQR